MKIFTKIDKEILMVLAAALVVILLVGFTIYRYAINSASKVQNLTGGAQITNTQ